MLVTNPNDSALRQTARDAGFQLDFRFFVLHDQEMTLSIGGARGFGDGNGKNEWMVSLKVLN